VCEGGARRLQDSARHPPPSQQGARTRQCVCGFPLVWQLHFSTFFSPFPHVYMHACTAPGCTYVAKVAYILRQHERQHTGERPFACRVGCTAAFASRNGLLSHESLHARPHITCPEPGCDFIAANSAMLVLHSRKLGHAASVKCPFPNCDKVFASSITLTMHKKGPAHAGEGGMPMCKSCGATFSTVAEYDVHWREHRVERLVRAAKARKQKRSLGDGAEL